MLCVNTASANTVWRRLPESETPGTLKSAAPQRAAHLRNLTDLSSDSTRWAVPSSSKKTLQTHEAWQAFMLAQALRCRRSCDRVPRFFTTRDESLTTEG